MNFQLYHDLTFDVLYGGVAILIFVIFERGLYLSYLSIRAGRLARAVGREARAPQLRAADIKARDPISGAIARYTELGAKSGVSRAELEDYSSALFIEVDKKISARLWILDTIITAAPLLGLLGTILGIMQTFTALAQGGVSDPGEVSRGIGMALIATAIGIATALLGLLGHNILSRRSYLLTEDFKFLLLRLTPTAAVDGHGADSQHEETVREDRRLRMRIQQ
ncbi:MAG TPA: MotA/TolQ/ExbB proton channel family protein [Steroidobacteraceae bacterium]|jgi:biopolymer transport protein ExbB|nr:MotA/TolQ/ExbB proton channel family protein [Steroidobacteraceae bacterium]